MSAKLKQSFDSIGQHPRMSCLSDLQVGITNMIQVDFQMKARFEQVKHP